METIKKNANKILWVEYWIHEIDTTLRDYDITAYQERNGWTCEIDLPLIDGFVRVRTNTEVDAMLGAAERAAELIDRFMKMHPEIKIQNIFEEIPYDIESDENGRFKSIHINKEYNDKVSKELKVRFDLTSKAIKELDDQLSKSYGDDLYVKIVNKSLLGEGLTFTKMTDVLTESIEDKNNIDIYDVNFFDLGERIAIVCTASKTIDANN